MFNRDNFKVFILAGGKGTRLQSVVNDVPKPMAPIGSIPFLEYLLKIFVSHGFKNYTFLTGYLSDVVELHFNDGSHLGLNINYSVEKEPLGTGGAFKKAISDNPVDKCLLVNGDTFFNFDINQFILDANSHPAIALLKKDELSRYGSVEISDDNQILEFIEKDKSRMTPGLINGGTYYLSKSIADYIPDGFVSLESDIFPILVKERLLKGIPVDGNFIDIGIPDDYIFAQKWLPQWCSTIET